MYSSKRYVPGNKRKLWIRNIFLTNIKQNIDLTRKESKEEKQLSISFSDNKMKWKDNMTTEEKLLFLREIQYT
jgi:hypothetical protein